MLMPIARSFRICACTTSESRIAIDSVISSSSIFGGKPVFAMIAATVSEKFGSSSWRIETLTATVTREPVGEQAADVVDRALEDEEPDIRHEPGLLGDRDELAGRDVAALRMAPAHQRLAGRGDSGF